MNKSVRKPGEAVASWNTEMLNYSQDSDSQVYIDLVRACDYPVMSFLVGKKPSWEQNISIYLL